ncbi:MAG: ComF family protein [Proteobacteria bacterium]|nr:ComF family protein [Pseudomonadota bacterium]
MLLNSTNTAHNFLKAVLEIIYPVHCGGCDKKGDILCRKCIDSLRVVEDDSTCPVCGRWLGERAVCGECIQNKRGFREGYYGFYFENRLRDAIHAFKFHGRKDVGKHLVHLINEKIISFSESFDCIIPMPVTERRLKERGFNQSFIIGEEISKITGKPVYHSILYKTRDTMDQYSLHRDERKKNIKGAFTVKNGHDMQAKRVLLVDDLFTTGYTAKEASGALLKAGAGHTLFFALARTPS